MNNVNLIREAAALAGYTVDSSTGQDTVNKARAQRRINIAKADIIGRYGGKWPANYKEGWLALNNIYNTGTATFTQNSRVVTGSGTAWNSQTPSIAVGSKIKGPDVAYYKIASIQSDTQLTLTEPFQGTTLTGQTYQIWTDEYMLYPEVLSIGGFIDYNLPSMMSESLAREMKDSYPFPTSVNEPTIFTVIGRDNYATYSVGTVSGTLNTYVLTGNGTSWLANLHPGFTITIGAYTYTIKSVDSDTQVTLYQLLVTSPATATYTAYGKNALKVRFLSPSNQRIVHYWYWAKDYPLVNDADEDWICESFPKTLVNGVVYFDYIDKNDVARASTSNVVYEDSIKNMKVSTDNAYTGVRTIGYYVPDIARE